jgi:hypothetical protein
LSLAGLAVLLACAANFCFSGRAIDDSVASPRHWRRAAERFRWAMRACSTYCILLAVAAHPAGSRLVCAAFAPWLHFERDGYGPPWRAVDRFVDVEHHCCRPGPARAGVAVRPWFISCLEIVEWPNWALPLFTGMVGAIVLLYVLECR